MVTGQFQNAGIDKTLLHMQVRWSSKGKTWKSIIDLKAHFAHLKAHNISVSPLWEIIEISDKPTNQQTSYPAAAVFS